MFEYAVCPMYEEGRLLDYGICNEGSLNALLGEASIGSVNVSDGITVLRSDNDFVEPLLLVMFRPASPDCQTGK